MMHVNEDSECLARPYQFVTFGYTSRRCNGDMILVVIGILYAALLAFVIALCKAASLTEPTVSPLTRH